MRGLASFSQGRKVWPWGHWDLGGPEWRESQGEACLMGEGERSHCCTPLCYLSLEFVYFKYSWEPHLQMRKLRFREVRQYIQGRTASEARLCCDALPVAGHWEELPSFYTEQHPPPPPATERASRALRTPPPACLVHSFPLFGHYETAGATSQSYARAVG